MVEPGQNQPASESPVDLALADYLRRIDRGEQIDRAAFLADHSGVAEDLRSYFDSVDALERMAGPASLSGADHKASIDTAKSFTGQETLPPDREPKSGNPQPQPDSFPETFGRYRILKLLGQGAMGIVYLASDTELDRQIALKIPRFNETEDPDLIERFYREARSAAALHHRNICPLFDIGEVDGMRYITMAYIDGRSLSDFIDPQKPQPQRQIVSIVRKLALALQVAHAGGVIHRDLKPANILIDKSSEPVIMDFGLARQINKQEDVRITQSGALIGSPAYMSPEQVESELDAIGPQSDIYGLGVIFYEFLTGQLPFRGSIAAVIGQIIAVEPQRPSKLRPDIDPALEAICLKMMAKQRDARFASMREVAEELTKYLKSERSNSKTPMAEAELVEAMPVAEVAGAAEFAEDTEPPAVSKREDKSADREQAEALFRTAKKCLQVHDYEQALQIFAQIPDKHLGEQMQALQEKTQERQDEIGFLVADIDDSLKRRQHADLLPKVTRLLKLKPGHRKGRELHAELTAGRLREPKTVKLKLGPMGIFRIPTWVVWTAASAFTAAVVFGVVTFLVKTEQGLVTVEIHDESITAKIDGETITFNNSGNPIHVEAGRKELIVERDGLKSKTEEFTLKKDGKLALHVWIENDEFRISEKAPPEKPSQPGKQTVADNLTSTPSAPGESRPSLPPLVQTSEFKTSMHPVRFSRDGRFVLGIAWGKNLRMSVIDVTTGRQVQLADQGWGSQQSGGWASAFAVSPVESLASGASSKGRLLLWDYDTGQLRHDLVGHTAHVHEVEFTPDGKQLLSSSLDGTIRVWDVAPGKQERLFDETKGDCLAVSPDGLYFAEGSHRQLNFRNLRSGKVLWNRTYEPGYLLSECTFSSDGTRLAAISGGKDQNLTIYSTRDGRVIRTLSSLEASLGKPVDLRYLADDRLLLSVHYSLDQTLHKMVLLLRDTESGKLLQKIDNVGSADVSPDGSMVVTKETKGIVHIWRLRKEDLPTSTEVSPKQPATSARADHSDDSLTPYEILTSDEWEWTKPVFLGDFDTANNLDTALTDDLVSWIDHSRHIPTVDSDRTIKNDLWMFTRKPGERRWAKPVSMGPTINSNEGDVGGSISQDGLWLVFDSDRPGGSGKSDLWMSRRASIEEPWSKPFNLGPKINTPKWEQGGEFSPDARQLLFSSRGRKGLKYLDLWMCERETVDSPWSAAVNLGPNVNSKFKEMSATLSRDGRVLMFLSDRPGGNGKFDVWMCTRPSTKAPWSKGVNVGSPINTAGHEFPMALSADGSLLLFRHIPPEGPDAPGHGYWTSRRVRKATDSDRATAQWVLELGGAVTIDIKAESRILRQPSPLPSERFHVTDIDLFRKPQVDDEGLKNLAGLFRLKTLGLREAGISDAGLRHLSGLTSLQSLTLNETKVGDAGLQHLKSLTNLNLLKLQSTRVTDAGLRDLQAALPNCTIEPAPSENGWVDLLKNGDLSQWKSRKGGPAKWRSTADYLEIVPKTGDIQTRRNFTDFQLQLEFWVPKLAKNVKGQKRGNSGVYLQGRHEIQILDSFGIHPPTDQDCGALYKLITPWTNACKPPGQWQSFDITFHAPKKGQGRAMQPGRITTVLNGTMVIDDQPFSDASLGGLDQKVGEPGPIMLQNHANKVRFRYIRIRELKSTASGSPANKRSRAVSGSRENSTDGSLSPIRGTLTLRGTATFVFGVLEKRGIKLQYDENALRRAGIDLRRAKTGFKVTDAPAEEMLRQICGPLGLVYTVKNKIVTVRPKSGAAEN